jgi:hypothetical protein
MVTKKKVDSNGHVMSFLSHEKICVPVHKDLNHWVLFVICPADGQITIIDSLYDQGPWHGWHMHSVVVDKQLNLVDCGVFTCMAIYCLVHGLDYRTMPTCLFANQARISVYYTIMGYQFDHDNNYNPALDEVLGASTIVDDDAPPIDYRDDANQHERGQPTLTGSNPPSSPQVTAADLQFPNKDGEISLSDYDDDDPNDEE